MGSVTSVSTKSLMVFFAFFFLAGAIGLQGYAENIRPNNTTDLLTPGMTNVEDTSEPSKIIPPAKSTQPTTPSGASPAPSPDSPRILKFPKFNLSYTCPANIYIGEEKQDNDNMITVSMVNRAEDILFLLSCYNLPDDNALTTRIFIRKDSSNFESEGGKIFYSDIQDVTIDGLKGIWYSLIDKKKYAVVSWACVSDKRLYFMRVVSVTKNVEYLRKHAREYFDGLSRIPSAPKTPAKKYTPPSNAFLAKKLDTFAFRSEDLGFEIQLQGKSIEPWKELPKINPNAECGGICAQPDMIFFVEAFPYGQDRPDDDAIKAGLLIPFSSQRDLQAEPEKKHGSGRWYPYRYSVQKDNVSTLYCSINILIYPRCAYLVYVGSIRKYVLPSCIKSVMSSITISQKGPSNSALMPKGLTKRKWLGMLFNEAGMYHYNTREYDKALMCLYKAIQLDPSHPVFLANAQEILNLRGEYHKSLQLVRDHWKQKLPPLIIANQACSYFGLNGYEQARRLFQQVFKAGYIRDDYFLTYVNSLALINKAEKIYPTLRAYLKRRSSASLELEVAKVLRQAGRFKDAISLMESLRKRDPNNDTILGQLFGCYLDNNDTQTALELADSLISQNKNVALAYYAKAQAELALQKIPQAQESLKQYLKFCPDDTDAKNLLTNVSAMLSQGDNSLVKEKNDPVPLPAILKEQMQAASEDFDAKGYGSYSLYSITAVSYQPDKEQKSTLYEKVKVLDRSNVSRYSTYIYSFDPLYERIYVNDVIVRNEKGTIVSRGQVDDYYVIDRQDNQCANYDCSLHIPIAALQPGYTIELTLTKSIFGDHSRFWFRRYFFNDTNPSLLTALYVQPPLKNIAYAIRNLPPPEHVDGGWLWQSKEPRVISFESYMPPPILFLQSVTLSDARNNWADIAREYLDEIQDQMAIPDDVRTLAQKLTADAASENEKIDLLAEYVQKNLTYKAIAFGRRARIPSAAGQILKNRYGDCKDHSLLLWQMLQSVSIPAHLVLVNTDEIIEEDIPSPDQFDHMIVMAEPADGPRFLDMTNKEFNLSLRVPTSLGGFRVLLLDPRNGKLLTIPNYAADSDHVSIHRDIEVIDDASVRVSENLTLSGYSAESMRGYLRDQPAADHKKLMQSLLNQYVRSARLVSVDIQEIDNNRHDLSIQWVYTATEMCKQEQGQLQVTPPCVWEQHMILPSAVPDRQLSFRLNRPTLYESTVTVKPGPTFQINPIPRMPDTQTTKYTHWHQATTITPAGLCTKLKFQLQPGTFEPNEYEDFRQQAIRALQPIESAVYLTKKSSPTPAGKTPSK